MKNIKIVKAKYIVETTRRHGKAVMCLDTGEVWASAKECSDVNNFKYDNFHYSLKKGIESSDGKLYCYVENMSYYADAIQSRIYAKAKIEYDAARLKMAAYRHLFEA